MVISVWLLVFGYWCLGIGVWLLVFGYWCLVIGVWLLFGYWKLIHSAAFKPRPLGRGKVTPLSVSILKQTTVFRPWCRRIDYWLF
ncbi:MAG: hypothetical protein AABZ27_04395 [Candidatus Omnitrophota bacterium]